MGRTPILPLEPTDYEISHIENRGSIGAGFIYFETPNYEGQDVRMGWFGGEYDEEREENRAEHDTARHQPYVFMGNWGEATFHQIIAAWDVAVKHKLPGFAEYSEAYGEDKIRWMNGSTFVLADRWTLTMAGYKERQTAIKNLRKLAKSGM